MTAFANPALKALVAEIKTDLVLAQVSVRRLEKGFELRHVQDREGAPENLRLVDENEIRALAQFTASGAFRPLKSAPNLQTGWRLIVADETKLEFALSQIYPGAIADWFAVRSAKAAPTNYGEFTRRQTGMYRITAMLTDAQAAPMIRACCHNFFCLKQRLWTVTELETDSVAEKSLIPCLEPCAILLEFARTAMRLEQQEISGTTGKTLDIQTPEEIREADFENPKNPRRIQLVLEKRKVRS
ncbi:MAG: DR2241 family protein [Verrucomicrobiota bacterium]